MDAEALNSVMGSRPLEAVIHLAGLKAVGESVREPLLYYENNLVGSLHLLRAMALAGVKRLLFSSSATVYGSMEPPFTEDTPTGVGVSNPYGWTKSMLEQVFRDAAVADKTMQVALLRYFNPVGAHESGRIGEDPQGIPNNLMPCIMQAAVGRRPDLTVFGDDYDTADGTAERDYVHVVDLAKGHCAALEWMLSRPVGEGFTEAFNLGTGTKHSVRAVIAAMEAAVGRDIPHTIGARRPGDLACVFAKVDKAREVLGWTAERGLEDMCVDSWRWQRDNPRGYDDEDAAGEDA